METKGYLHVYTGNGKGKTTAAFGLALRALCSGKDVYVGQFVKSMKYNETKVEGLFDGTNPAFGRIRIEQLGRGCFIGRDPEPADAEAAHKGWSRCAELLRSGEYAVVILDELTIALHFGLLSTAVVLDVLRNRHPAVEVVITGRYAPQGLIDAADLVTDMCEVKHYYRLGLLSRDGIDR
ncbi:cob(I)yrinic acid a,c-diamide adenosyltransferase [Alistipes sp.]|uniref:cob(I)yrinic acid a,c-diamide adenosyltransferase n=1 Tax=Alistipes sp. TaxID=1872444 RepID=UPI0025C59E26|nr:cob(I)yrinic acid a,c-diamide adenosyltransferase [Alistipes sp.]